jgi:predicted RNA polymerase sigma factor
MLLHLAPSPVARLHRAVALRHTAGPRAALDSLEALGDALDGHHLFHATRAELLRALDRGEEAAEATRRALALATNPAERELLARRLAATDEPGSD